jgi:release factor glutamine methyltransferase
MSLVTTLVTTLRAAGCVFAEEEAELILTTADGPAEAERMAARRAAGEPVEHVVGWAGFLGMRIAVGPGVFVPRRRTEFLAGQALELMPPGAVAVDLCCGAGALGAAFARHGAAEVHAADLDPAAVAYARRTLEPLGVHVHGGDLFDALPDDLRGRVDVLAANVPYVPTGEVGLLPAEAREHEPLLSLDGGDDGLGVLRRVAREAAGWLAPGGAVLSETSERQASAALAAFTAAGLDARLAEDDDLGATVVLGTRPGTVRACRGSSGE